MRIKKDFTLRTVMGQNVVMAEGNNADSYGKLLTLNSSATMLWEALKDRAFDTADVARLLQEHYGLDAEEAQHDAAHFVDLLRSKGLVEE